MATSFSRTTRSLNQDTAVFAVVGWLLATLFLSAWLLWFCFARITVYQVSNNARLEVKQSTHPIAALVAGKVIAISVTLGQLVQAGEVLVSLDADTEKLRLQEEQSRLRALPPQIAALQHEIAALEKAKTEDYQASLAAGHIAKSRQNEAEAALGFAKDHAQRLSKLSAAGRIALIETLRAKAEAQKLSSSKEALSSEIQRLAFDTQTRMHMNQAKIENLRGQLLKLQGESATAQSTVARLQQDIERHVIRAPAAGKIGDISAVQVGTYIGAGEKIGTVIPEGGLRIVADFNPAAVLGKIKPGQLSHMRLAGFPWTQYGTIAARVTRVAAEIRDNQVRVEFFPEPSALSRISLQHGLPGAIEVNIEQLTPALLMLRSAGQWLSAAAGNPSITKAGKS
ncbi:MAG: HlyD family efflux transporter periplasmic adaptor subunit [Methylococcales bacterium]